MVYFGNFLMTDVSLRKFVVTVSKILFLGGFFQVEKLFVFSSLPIENIYSRLRRVFYLLRHLGKVLPMNI